jgi:hypothetical protein
MNLSASKLVTTTYRQHGLPVVTGNAHAEISAAPLCRRFRPSPCPSHYGGRLATTPSADFCPVTPGVTAGRAAREAVGSGGDPIPFEMALTPAPRASTGTLGFGGDPTPFGAALSPTSLAPQAAGWADLPNKNMTVSSGKKRDVPSTRRGSVPWTARINCQCTTAAFTLSPVPGGLCHLVLTRPETEPFMWFVSVGSHLCAWASFRPPLTLPLPSASSAIYPTIGHYRYSYRGLSTHKFMPMSGVHHALQPTPWIAIAFPSPLVRRG